MPLPLGKPPSQQEFCLTPLLLLPSTEKAWTNRNLYLSSFPSSQYYFHTQFDSVGNICSRRKCFSNRELYLNWWNETIFSRDKCSSNISAIARPAETQVKNIPLLTPLLLWCFCSRNLSLQGPQPVLVPLLFFPPWDLSISVYPWQEHCQRHPWEEVPWNWFI